MCMTQNMGVIFFENGGVWHKMYDTKIATNISGEALANYLKKNILRKLVRD